jgi:hypothetical protein
MMVLWKDYILLSMKQTKLGPHELAEEQVVKVSPNNVGK